jgi:hypothetical protein
MTTVLLAALVPAPALADWGFHVAIGTAYNVPLPLVVRQEGEEGIRATARYATRGFRFPLYYVVRATRWAKESGWAIELRHHKLFLERRPPEIQQFDVSHGYNLLTAYRVRREDRASLGLGVGIVIAHPENEVRGRPLGNRQGLGGYVLAGPALGAFAMREIPLGADWRAGVELATTAAWARVPVAGGHADAPNLGVHGTIGIGRR